MGGKAAHVGGGKGPLFGLTLKWKRDLEQYGKLCTEKGKTHDSVRYVELAREIAELGYNLAARAAGFELAARGTETKEAQGE